MIKTTNNNNATKSALEAETAENGQGLTRPARRRVMLGAAGVLAAGIVASAPAALAAMGNPDAKLIALCARFDALQRQTLSYYEGGSNEIEDDNERDALIGPLADEQRELLDRITDSDMHATTPEGIKARLKMIMLYEPEAFTRPNGWDDHMIAALLKDMTAMQA